MAKAKLYYWVRNCGDGSVAVEFTVSKKEAKDAEKKDGEEYGEPWGEPSVGEVQLEVKNGKLFLLQEVFEQGKFKTRKIAIS